MATFRLLLEVNVTCTDPPEDNGEVSASKPGLRNFPTCLWLYRVINLNGL